jgi:ribonuclease P protein component
MDATPPAERAGLGRTERLRDRAEIDRLFRRGARIERAAFVLLWRAEPGRRAAAFAAGRKLGGSVQRNRARRRLRESYRRVTRGLLPAEGVRLCLVARPAAMTLGFEELTAQVGEALALVARRARA